MKNLWTFLVFFSALASAEDDSLIKAIDPSLRESADSAWSHIKENTSLINRMLDTLMQKLSGRKADSTPEAQLYRIREEYAKQAKNYDRIEEIKAEELLQLLSNRDLVLIDVREPEERSVSTIPGSLSIEEFVEKYQKRKDLPQLTLITFDTIGFRSLRYALELKKLGLSPRNLEGGLLVWIHNGGKLVKILNNGKTAPTDSVHVFSQHLNLLPPKYQTLW